MYNNNEKREVIGVYPISAFLGIEILGEIEYTPDGDYIFWRWSDETKIHRSKIYYNTKSEYFFRTRMGRVYLKDTMRV